MNDREKWREMIKGIRAGGTTWWWWWKMLHSHHQLYIYIYMLKHKQHNKDERTHSFRKIYLSHFIRNGFERVVKGFCVRGELKTEQTATCRHPDHLSLAALISCSAGLLNRGSWGSIALCRLLVLSTACYLQLDWLQLSELSVAPGYCLSSTCFLWASHQSVHSQGYTLISSTGCTCSLIDGWIEGQYVTKKPN